jgi:phage tail-like protein
MTDASSWLQYLPPVLSEEPIEPGSVPLPLGSLLRVFEKLLTGIADGEPVTHDSGNGSHEHAAVAETIDRLHRLFDPWATPERFLPWLAGWVSLGLPPVWDEYQRRTAIAGIARIHAQRGRREGLGRYLDLHAVAPIRPRVAIDDGSKVLFTRPAPDRTATVHTLLSHGPVLRGDASLALAGLVRPQCITATPLGDLVLGDAGGPPGATAAGAAVWRVSRTGLIDMAGAPPKPRPLGHDGWRLNFPAALAVDGAAPWHLYVLDRAVQGMLHRLTGPALDRAEPVAAMSALQVKSPVAMAFDARGRLLILDRRGPDPPAVVEVDVSASPPTSTVHSLTQVKEPRSLLVRADGRLVIGDGREQDASTPADLILVDRADPAAWTEQRLLSGLTGDANPLVAPSAIVQEDATRLLVLDLGLKPFVPPRATPFMRKVVRPAAVFRVDLGGSPPTVTRATATGQLVYPTGMVLHQGSLYLCDPGEPEVADRPRRPWRAVPAEFGVIVHFTEADAGGANPTPERLQALRAIVQDVRRILDDQKPARTLPTVTSSV